MIDVKNAPTLDEVAPKLPRVFEAATRATTLLRNAWSPERGAPVYTRAGEYTTRGWTEWTQGVQFGNALHRSDAIGDREMLDYGREGTLRHMATHVTHTGVHDHGFNNVSTYGNLLRLMAEGRIEGSVRQADFYRLALKLSGAVQASRWTPLADGLGFVPSFNGPHSLFSDTIRSMRAPALGHQLGHVLMGEQDARISLLRRLLQHALATATYNVYYGNGRDIYDVRGRTVHESIFNVNNGVYRCPSTQQGYAPFTTWTRGLAWIVSGFAEELEWLATVPDADFAVPAQEPPGVRGSSGGRTGSPDLTDRTVVEAAFLRAACATADFFLANTPTDGVPYWDTGAPGLAKLGDYLNRPADPFNQYEPVDSSAAAIGAQGLWRLGTYLDAHAERLAAVGIDLNGDGAKKYHVVEIRERGRDYRCAALVCADTLFGEPYLSTAGRHQGILLHTIYHRPNGWDYLPPDGEVPHGESCMWGDYHLLELAVMLKREHEGVGAQRFFDVGPAEGPPR